MKSCILILLALLIVGCGNQRQQQVQAIFTHKLDSVKQVYIKAFDSISKQHLHIVDSMKQLLRDTELKLSLAKARHPFIRENKVNIRSNASCKRISRYLPLCFDRML